MIGKHAHTTDVLVPFMAAQVLVYLIAAPLLVSVTGDSDAKYGAIIIQFTVFFVVPLFCALLGVRRSNWRFRPIEALEISRPRLVFGAVVYAAFELVYWYTVLSADLLTRRIGTEVIAETFADLSIAQLVIIRLHDTLSLVLPALFALVALRGGGHAERLVGGALLAISLASFSAHTLLNSRLQFVVGIALIAAAILQVKPLVLTWRSLTNTAVVLLVVIYVLSLGSNLRGAIAKGDEPTLSILNPASGMLDSGYETAAAGAMNEWVRRLDCADLIERMDESLERSGFEWGRAWKRPIFMLYGALTSPEEYAEVKREAKTTAKAYLLDKHTDLDRRDYYSCALTDVYANFWVFGLLIAVLYFVVAISLVNSWLSSTSAVAFVIALMAFLHVSAFEAEFFAHLLGWVRLVPALLLLLLLNPITKILRSESPGGVGG